MLEFGIVFTIKKNCISSVMFNFFLCLNGVKYDENNKFHTCRCVFFILAKMKNVA